jgi:hypothetical protein
VQDHSFHAQAIFDINQKIGSLETGLSGATERTGRLEIKVDQMQIDLTAIKTTTGHIETLIKSALATLRAIGAGIGVFLLGVLAMWIKHHMNW